MKAKFEYLISEYGYRVGEIAAKVGVDTPVISHLIKGRNKPNYVLTGKIIAAFPEFSALWWLGLSDDPKGAVPKIAVNTESESAATNLEQVGQPTPIEKATSQPASLFDLPNFSAPSSSNNSAAQVVRVIVVYSDNTFETFTPKK